jgi:xanthine dehydrogenase accessory factor
MNTWEFIHEKLFEDIRVMLLIVIKSEGSSPGRQGFKMAVAADGTCCGTIGGGIMEHKFVEKTKHLLAQNHSTVLLQEQTHSKEVGTNHSGMMCSGSQLNAIIPLSQQDKKTVLSIFTGKGKAVRVSPAGIALVQDEPNGLVYHTDEDWVYTEPLSQGPTIHIIGGGHVSLALSEIMNFLGFYIKVYDDRPGVRTLLENNFANEKIIIPAYDQLGEYINPGQNEYAVIMTVGYRTDKIALQQLYYFPFYYLGLLGSDRKIDILYDELHKEGILKEELAHVFTPIGINILSKTTNEIAVSIAAQIIQQKNKALPTGRQKLATN